MRASKPNEAPHDPPSDAGPTRAEWRALVAAVLAKSRTAPQQDTDPEDALSGVTYDGIRIRPLYTAEDAHGVELDGVPGHPPFVRGATALAQAATGWDVRTRHADVDAAAVNEAIRSDLETGATSLWLVVGEQGLPVEQLGAALQGVYLDLAPIALQAGTQTEAAARALLDVAAERGTDLGELRGSLGADPVGTRARTGAQADLATLPALVELAVSAPQLHLATVDATVYHDAGASDAQELGIATAVAVAYLRALTEAGLSVDEALRRIEFRWAVTVEQFGSIAKLRAARRVWDRVAELCGAGADRRGQFQHAVTSAAMLTRRDPWTNMLRTTVACFSAAVGGADVITVLPFDSAIGRSDAFGRRIARNTHAVLHDESSLARVIDAAGGSWYVESLTDELAQRAWDVFVDVERAGGALPALDDGVLAQWLERTHQTRLDDIAHRRTPITGVSEFADIHEAPVRRPAAPSAPQGLLPSIRYADPFEELRDRAEAAPQRPRVFLATLGPLAAHGTRAAFAANLFQAGGLECVTGPVAEFADAGTPVACICSSDKVYADEADAAAKALREAGAQQIWLAGKFEAADVDGTLYAGCDALAVLRSASQTLGVQA